MNSVRGFAVGMAILLSLPVTHCSGEPAEPTLLLYDPEIVPIVDPLYFPFPSDAYRRGGVLELKAAADAVPAVRDLLLPALQKEAGFGTNEAVFFGYQGPTPESPRPMTASGGLAGILDIDPTSPDFGKPVPAEVVVLARLRLIAVGPALGYPLRGGGRYLAWISRTFGVINGQPDDAFVRVRDFKKTRSDREQELAATLGPALALLQKQVGINRRDVVAATVWTTLDPIAPMARLAAAVPSLPFTDPIFASSWWGSGGTDSLNELYGIPSLLVAGADAPGGVSHTNVGAVYTGTVQLHEWIDFQARTSFADPTGKAVAANTLETVPFVLAIPNCPRPVAGYPVVIVQHGLGDAKSFALIQADPLGTQCMAAIGIDAVGHSARSPGARDRIHNLSHTHSPDGIADKQGLAGIDQIFLLDPPVARDNLRQSALDLVQLAELLATADWILPSGQSSPLFNPEQIFYVGESMGSIVGSLVLALSPHIKAGVLAVGGGNFLRIFTEGPGFRQFILAGGLLAEGNPTLEVETLHPVLALMQAILDGADPVNYAVHWLRSPLPGVGAKHVLLVTAERDQLIAASASEGLAVAAGLEKIEGYINWRHNFDDTLLTAPVSGNVSTAEGQFTGVLQMFPDANHGLIQYRCATIRNEAFFPWKPLAKPYSIINPTARVQEIAAAFLHSAQSGIPSVPAAGARGTAQRAACP